LQNKDQAKEARNQLRHQVMTPVFFMVTKTGEPLPLDKHHLEGKIVDVSESGFRFKSPMPLNEKEQISFEIVSDTKTLISGVAEIVHCNNELVCGTAYQKVKYH
jgi:hypothetical protein